MLHIVDWLRDTPSAYPHKVITVCGSRQISYEQAAQRVAALAAALKACGARLGEVTACVYIDAQTFLKLAPSSAEQSGLTFCPNERR